MKSFTLSVENADDNLIKAIKAMLKTNPSLKFKFKEKKQKNIPLLDEAIEEYKRGEAITYANYKEYKTKIDNA